MLALVCGQVYGNKIRNRFADRVTALPVQGHVYVLLLVGQRK